MREIKFRQWDKRNRRFHYFGFLEFKNSPLFVSPVTMFDEKSYMERYPVSQYTGMKDTNGVAIYEGDVVQFTYWWFDGNHAESLLTGEIVYSDAVMSFQLKGVKNKAWQLHTGCDNDNDYLTPFSELNFDEADFSVIGNIYENPELLGDSNEQFNTSSRD